LKPWEKFLMDCHERILVAHGFFALNLRDKGFEALADADTYLRRAIRGGAPEQISAGFRRSIGTLYESKVRITYDLKEV
jgi:hypothetical protein